MTDLISWTVVLAIVNQIIAFAIWCSLVKKLERWLWWTVWFGFVVLLNHRIGEVLRLYGTVFSNATALAFSFIALIAVIQTKILLRRRDMAKARLIALQAKLAEIKADPQESVAQKLAEVLVDLKDQLKYYEAQAKDLGLPSYPDKNGGHDRTRTG